MARYRVDNQYLSADEYFRYVDGKWSFYIIAITMVCASLVAYYYILPSNYIASLSHLAKFGVLISSVLFSGMIAYFARNFIRNFIQIGLFLVVTVGAIYFLVKLAWHISG